MIDPVHFSSGYNTFDRMDGGMSESGVREMGRGGGSDGDQF